MQYHLSLTYAQWLTYFMNDPLVIENLVKKFGSQIAVDDVSFSVKPGEIFGLLGPNGAGKTTIISSIVTLHEPDTGRIYVCGKDVQKDPKHAKSMVGYVPQELIHYSFFSVEDVLKFHLGYRGIFGKEEKIERLLKRFELWEHRKKSVRALSGGMKRRMLIAKALMHDPKVLLLDEPSAGVDIELRNALWQLTKELRDEGMAIVLTTHYLEEAEMLCDRVAIIDKGKIKKMDRLKTLLESAEKTVVITLSEEITLSHRYLVENMNQQLIFTMPTDTSLGALLEEITLDMKQILNIQVRECTLENVFQKTVWGEG
jgi:ABC-2 type transport system ATP-binding protein